MAFGRHSALVASVAIATATGAVLLGTPRNRVALREPLAARSRMLRVEFPHDRHRAVNCIACHHNYTDGSGQDTCIGCHRSTRTDLKQGPEARFHGFCLGCHRDPDPSWQHHGPVTGCVPCHRGAPGWPASRS